mmetsp:Transcript_47938/g.111997  ORF Transcript_47938/g.111997 Transcript_47938/m.111997 type:complete len:240 (-) Transcript_47938:128-847(-)
MAHHRFSDEGSGASTPRPYKGLLRRPRLAQRSCPAWTQRTDARCSSRFVSPSSCASRGRPASLPPGASPAPPPSPLRPASARPGRPCRRFLNPLARSAGSATGAVLLLRGLPQQLAALQLGEAACEPGTPSSLEPRCSVSSRPGPGLQQSGPRSCQGEPSLALGQRSRSGPPNPCPAPGPPGPPCTQAQPMPRPGLCLAPRAGRRPLARGQKEGGAPSGSSQRAARSNPQRHLWTGSLV